jgi:hypothetical protein
MEFYVRASLRADSKVLHTPEQFKEDHMQDGVLRIGYINPEVRDTPNDHALAVPHLTTSISILLTRERTILATP